MRRCVRASPEEPGSWNSYTSAHGICAKKCRELTEAVGNCIPGDGAVVESSLVLDVKQQLLCHARTCFC